MELEDNLKKWKDCEHSFHIDCIAPWAEEKYTCPICREVDESLPIYELVSITGKDLKISLVRECIKMILGSNPQTIVSHVNEFQLKNKMKF
jgi:hypothetical protein